MSDNQVATICISVVFLAVIAVVALTVWLEYKESTK